MLNILLIEETAADATSFISQLQDFASEDIEVVWKSKLTDALALLESGQSFDQIWLDPDLSDLRSTDISKALLSLKRFVPAGEVRMIGSNLSSRVNAIARQQEVEVVSKNNNEMLAIVSELLKRRSSGTTVRVEQVRVEAALARVEWQVTQAVQAIERIQQQVNENAEFIKVLSSELAGLKDLTRKYPDLEAAVSNLRSDREDKRFFRLKRWELIVALVTTLIVSLVAPVILKAIDRLLPGDKPQIQPSPTETSPGRGKTT